MPFKSCGSANQRKFIGEIGIRFPACKTLTSPSCGYFQSLLSVWIVALRNLLCRKLNCANSQRETPRQVNLGLSLTISLRING